MPTEKKPSNTKLCPTCGTRLSENATRCLVCGSDLKTNPTSHSAKTIQGTRMPEITLSLPAVLGFLALFLIVGAALVYFSLFNKPGTPAILPTQTATITVTASITPSPTNTLVPTLALSATPLPPIDYTVGKNDTCISIAATFHISVNSLLLANDISTACILSINQKLKIPQPTPTASPEPTNTLSAADATEAACTKIDYKVAAGDSLSTISANYNVTIAALKSYNGLTSDSVYEGEPLKIPLCERKATAGPTPTATLPPPYAAPNLLLPADGAPFSLANDIITLQWASVGSLHPNEMYAVTIEDVTDGNGRKMVDYVPDTKYIIPTAFRPSDNTPHIMRWWVMPVRQKGTTSDGKPNWEPSGAPSAQRVFTWTGVATGGSTGPSATPNPSSPTPAVTSTPAVTPTP
jgi:LysM repeat protein